MRGFEPNGRDNSGFECAFPGLDTDAPAIARFEPGETPFRMRCDQIVSDGSLMREELIGDDYADAVAPAILRAGTAFPIAIEAGQRVCPAGL